MSVLQFHACVYVNATCICNVHIYNLYATIASEYIYGSYVAQIHSAVCLFSRNMPNKKQATKITTTRPKTKAHNGVFQKRSQMSECQTHRLSDLSHMPFKNTVNSTNTQTHTMSDGCKFY